MNGLLAVTAGLAVSILWWVVPMWAPNVAAQVPSEDTTEDPGLEQQIAEDQATASGPVEIRAGHVDLGPRFVDGTFTLMLHDDSSDPSVWRNPDEVVLRVGDPGRRPVPDDPAYGFLGATPGEPVWVVSQTEIPGVVWLGWNTQDSDVMERIDRGVTLSLQAAQGPGQVSLYLQSGAFGAPDIIWRSTDPEPGTIWVDTNTHTHANWVFSEPGSYLVRVAAIASIGGDDEVVATTDLRVAVGDAADAEVVRRDAWREPPPRPRNVAASTASGSSDAAAATEPTGDTQRQGSSALVIAVVAALFVVMIAISVMAQRRTRRLRDEAARLRGME